MFFAVGLSRNGLDPVPARLPQLSSLREYLRRGKHAGDDGNAGSRIGWLLPIPFYFLELLVGLVQALVFMLLTAVFTLLICQHEEASRQPARMNRNMASIGEAVSGSGRLEKKKKGTEYVSWRY